MLAWLISRSAESTWRRCKPIGPGDEIKFYGVAGGGFFHWFYSGEARKYPFNFAGLGDVWPTKPPPLPASIFSAATSSFRLLAN